MGFMGLSSAQLDAFEQWSISYAPWFSLIFIGMMLHQMIKTKNYNILWVIFYALCIVLYFETLKQKMFSAPILVLVLSEIVLMPWFIFKIESFRRSHIFIICAINIGFYICIGYIGYIYSNFNEDNNYQDIEDKLFINICILILSFMMILNSCYDKLIKCDINSMCYPLGTLFIIWFFVYACYLEECEGWCFFRHLVQIIYVFVDNHRSSSQYNNQHLISNAIESSSSSSSFLSSISESSSSSFMNEHVDSTDQPITIDIQ